MRFVADALRSLRRSRLLTLAAVACIALGSVATTGMATLVDATLLRPLPFPDAGRLVRVWIDEAGGDNRVSLSIPEAKDLLAASPFETVLITSRVRAVGLAGYAPSRFYAVLVAAFSAGALAVTSVGLFALLSHAAVRRSAEMGVRLALGATPRQAAMLLLRTGFTPIVTGALLGLVGALWAGVALRGLLYDVALFDAWAFGGALAVLAAVALIAGIVPARRVAAVDPLTVLRS